MDGFELTRRIRAEARLATLPVVLVTRLASAEDRARGAAAGADAHVVKGRLEQEKLLEAVARLLDHDDAAGRGTGRGHGDELPDPHRR
jgi:two-component system chemotaxis sensor kinase CheA